MQEEKKKSSSNQPLSLFEIINIIYKKFQKIETSSKKRPENFDVCFWVIFEH